MELLSISNFSSVANSMRNKIILSGVAVCVVERALAVLSRKWNRYPNGPIGLPFVGSMLSYIYNRKSFINGLYKYGPISHFQCGFENMIVINNGKSMNKIVKHGKIENIESQSLTNVNVSKQFKDKVASSILNQTFDKKLDQLMQPLLSRHLIQYFTLNREDSIIKNDPNLTDICFHIALNLRFCVLTGNYSEKNSLKFNDPNYQSLSNHIHETYNQLNSLFVNFSYLPFLRRGRMKSIIMQDARFWKEYFDQENRINEKEYIVSIFGNKSVQVNDCNCTCDDELKMFARFSNLLRHDLFSFANVIENGIYVLESYKEINNEIGNYLYCNNLAPTLDTTKTMDTINNKQHVENKIVFKIWGQLQTIVDEYIPFKNMMDHITRLCYQLHDQRGGFVDCDKLYIATANVFHKEEENNDDNNDTLLIPKGSILQYNYTNSYQVIKSSFDKFSTDMFATEKNHNVNEKKEDCFFIFDNQFDQQLTIKSLSYIYSVLLYQFTFDFDSKSELLFVGSRMLCTNRLLSFKDCNIKTNRLTIKHWSKVFSLSDNDDKDDEKDKDKDNDNDEILAARLLPILTNEVTKSLPSDMQGSYDLNRCQRFIVERNKESPTLAVLKIDGDDNSQIDVIGLVLIFVIEKEIKLGYLLKKDAWGNGYATEIVSAFVDYCKRDSKFKYIIQTVAGGVEKDNIASQKVLLKSGFKIDQQQSDDENLMFVLHLQQ